MIYICIHVCQAVVYHGDREKNCTREIGEQRQLPVINIITVIITIWLMNHHYNVGAIVTIWMTIILPYSRAVKWTQQLSGNIYIYFIFYALMYFCCIPISIMSKVLVLFYIICQGRGSAFLGITDTRGSRPSETRAWSRRWNSRP